MSILRNQWVQSGIPLHILEHLNTLLSFEERSSLPELTKDQNLYEEFELKFNVKNGIFQNLIDIKGRYNGAAVERNVIYDLRGKPLHQVDARLRIRTFIDLLGQRNEALITVKKPKPNSSEYGAREFEAEVELHGSEAEEISEKFLASGLEVVSSYERIRHYFSFQDREVKVDVDLFPDIGRFIEIEGKESDAIEVARLLNLKLELSNPTPYDTIHADWCLSQGLEEEDFISFGPHLDDVIAEETILAKSLHNTK